MNILLAHGDRIEGKEIIIVEGKSIDMENNKDFKPDSSVKKFTIEIDVFDNCQQIRITNHAGHKATYQELIGAIEIQRMAAIIQQSSINIKHWIDNNQLAFDMQQAQKEKV